MSYFIKSIDYILFIQLLFVSVLQTKFQESSKPGHSLYVKELQKRAGTTRPKDRTLFVVNVPPYCTQVTN